MATNERWEGPTMTGRLFLQYEINQAYIMNRSAGRSIDLEAIEQLLRAGKGVGEKRERMSERDHVGWVASVECSTEQPKAGDPSDTGWKDEKQSGTVLCHVVVLFNIFFSYSWVKRPTLDLFQVFSFPQRILAICWLVSFREIRSAHLIKPRKRSRRRFATRVALEGQTLVFLFEGLLVGPLSFNFLDGASQSKDSRHQSSVHVKCAKDNSVHMSCSKPPNKRTTTNVNTPAGSRNKVAAYVKTYAGHPRLFVIIFFPLPRTTRLLFLELQPRSWT